MQIELLADHPEFIHELAQWHQQEWSYLRPGFTLEDRIAKLQTCCERTAPPVVFVAFEGDQLFGSAMLLSNDMETRLDLCPWLAGVFTVPEFRGRGVASQLSTRVLELAAQLGFPRVYLYTPSAESFYLRLGWVVLERVTYRNTEVVIMAHD